MHGKESLENKIPQKGVISEEGLRHKYESCIINIEGVAFLGVGGGGNSGGLFASPLCEPHMLSRHYTLAVVL